eukprot:RCo034689
MPVWNLGLTVVFVTLLVARVDANLRGEVSGEGFPPQGCYRPREACEKVCKIYYDRGCVPCLGIDDMWKCPGTTANEGKATPALSADLSVAVHTPGEVSGEGFPPQGCYRPREACEKVCKIYYDRGCVPCLGIDDMWKCPGTTANEGKATPALSADLSVAVHTPGGRPICVESQELCDGLCKFFFKKDCTNCPRKGWWTCPGIPPITSTEEMKGAPAAPTELPRA